MAMRKSSRSELNKLREIVAFMIDTRKCPGCRKALIDGKTRFAAWLLEGTGRGVPLDPKAFSIHHSPRTGRGSIWHYICHMREEATKHRTRKGNRFVKGGR
jgi:hypothetical protein